MGGFVSKPEFDTPWRSVKFGTDRKKILIEEIRKIQPCATNLKCLRVILVGPAGSGKSSFINSLNNAFQGRITSMAVTDSIGNKSFTEEYNEFKIETGESQLSIFFHDVMGLESGAMNGCHQNDIIKAISGYIKNGYVPLSPEDKDYNNEPDFSDEIYCIVYVVAADRIQLSDDSVLEKLRNIRLQVRHLALPQIIVITNVDQACPLVKNNIQKIYLSKKIKEKMEWCCNTMGVSMCHIFPVVNYHEKIETNDDMDVLLLQALQQTIHLANDNVTYRLRKKESQNV